MFTRAFKLVLLVAALTAAAVPVFSIAPDTRPPGVTRWDTYEETPKPTPGPVPQVYTLSAPLAMPWAMDVDEHGGIYLLDHGRQCIMHFDQTGNLLASWPDSTHDAVWSQGRYEIKVMPGGVVYASAGPRLDNIRRITPTSDTFLPIGEESGGQMAIYPDGTYYLAGSGKRAENGTLLTSTLEAYTAEGKLVTTREIERVNRVEVGPDGLIYAPVYEDSVVIVFDKECKEVRRLDLRPVLGDNHPSAIWQLKLDRNGDMYLSDYQYIYRIDKNGKVLARWRPYRTVDDADCWIQGGVCTVRNGLIYARVGKSPRDVQGVDGVLQHGKHPKNSSEIQVFTPDGQCVLRYFQGLSVMGLPASVAIGADGKFMAALRGPDKACIYDADGHQSELEPEQGYVSMVIPAPTGGYFASCNGTLYRFDADGKNGVWVNKREGLRDIVQEPWQIAIDPRNGDLWGLTWRGILLHFDPQGKLIKALPENPKLNFRTFSVGMAIDSKGIIYLPNAWKHCILKVDMEGNILDTIGEEGSGLGELKYPEGLAIDSKDRLYVADSGNCRVQVFDADGKAIGFWGKRGSGIGELDRPYGLAFAADGTLWITDTFNDRIVKIATGATPQTPKIAGSESTARTVSLASDVFWKGMRTMVAAVPPVKAPVVQAEPQAGDVTVTGVVVAGSDDLTDVVYVESTDRSWGLAVTLPKSSELLRGSKARLTGKLVLKERNAKHLNATMAQKVPGAEAIGPLGMANVYVGDGYQSTSEKKSLSNLGMLVRTWGRVLSVDEKNNCFIINDGSYQEGMGLLVYAGALKKPLQTWPKLGQYISVSGISVTWVGPDGVRKSGLRIRGAADIELLETK